MTRTARLAAVVAVLAAARAAAWADQATISNIPYTDIQITDADGGKLTYALRGRNYDKPMTEVSHLQVMGRTALNQAENQLKAKKPAEAVALYDRAFAQADEAWLKRLVRCRRLVALDSAGLIGRAVEDWLTIADETSAGRAAIVLAPSRLGQRGSAENAKAIQLLEGRLKTRNVALLARVKQMLRELYTVEGAADKIALLDGAGPAGGGDNGNGGTTPAPIAPVRVGGEGLSGQLKEAQDQINAGRYAEAADNIKARLPRYSNADLPTALLLRGRALELQHQKSGGGDRSLLLEAGLGYMRIVSCFDPSTAGAPEALFRAGQVCQRLGNKVAAQNAWRLLMERSPDSEWAKKAEAALGG
ncbi:MAG TPA: hypothetical protein VM695_16700 [Phycisphaerae bacterium]|nr:hypothetical protein [Phycisphaerae bacterium]